MKKALLPILLIGLVVLVVVLDTQRRNAQKELQNLTVRLEQLQGGNSEENKERAQAVVARIKTHMTIPDDVDPTVATIVDVEALRAQNPFYNNAKNGDFLVVTPTRAILYDPEKDVIIDVVPVQIQQQPQQGAAASTPAATSARRMPSKQKLSFENMRSGAPTILSGALLLSIGFILGTIVTSVHGFVPVTFQEDSRDDVPTVSVQGMRNGLLLGTIKGGARFVAGNDVVGPSENGEFALKNPSICIDTVTIAVPAGMPFVASKKGKKYYPVESPSAQRLTPENRVYFPDAASAEKAGYVR